MQEPQYSSHARSPDAVPIAVVTGGARGIGRACALELARAGYFVYVNYARSAAAAAECVRAIELAGGAAEAIEADVGDEAAVAHMFDRIGAAARGPLAALVNNAGIAEDGLLPELDELAWHRVMRTNVDGTFHCSRRAVTDMLAERFGRIVNISSVVAGLPRRGISNYAASKGAIEAFTRALACEVGHKNITVNAVAPGYVDTDMMADVDDGRAARGVGALNAARRAGTPLEIASVVAFLCSRAASFVNGAVIAVDGGRVLGGGR